MADDPNIPMDEAPEVSIADVLNAPAEPLASEPPPPEPEVDERDFADQLIEAERGAAEEAPAEEKPDPMAELRSQLEEQAETIRQLKEQRQAPQQPQFDPRMFGFQPPQPPTFDQRVQNRIEQIAKQGNYDPRDQTLRLFAEQQVRSEDMQNQLQFYGRQAQEAQQNAILANNQRDMDRAFFSDPELNRISQKNEKLGAKLYESAFAIWLAQGGKDARGAVSVLRQTIDAATEHRVNERLAATRSQAARGRPIPNSNGRTISLARVPPGQNTPTFKPRNASKAIEEAGEQAAKYLREMDRESGIG